MFVRKSLARLPGFFCQFPFTCFSLSLPQLTVCMHNSPVLWAFHKVHHSAEHLTPLTLYRLHFVELFLASARRMATTLITTTVILLLSSQFLQPWEILGVTALSAAFNLFAANLRHSHIPIRFGALETIFISPFLHQIHHSKNEAHFDKNFGVSIALWDRLFGSYLNIETCHLEFGLNEKERNHNMTLSSAFIDPFFELADRLKQFQVKTHLTVGAISKITLACLLLVGCDDSKRAPAPPAG
jgi:hypothetical protein